MELVEYYHLLIKRLWIIVVAMAIGLAGAFLLSRLQTPVYRSTIILNMRPRRLDWGLQQTTKGLMRNYAINVTSRETALQVIEALDLDMTSEQLRGALTVTPIESDFLLQLDADAADPALAQAIAQTTAEKFVGRIHDYMLKQDKQDRVELTMRDYALPGTLHRPNMKMNLAVGGVLGLFLGTLIALVLRWMESDVIQTGEDIRQHLGLPELGVIPDVPGQG